MIPVLASRMAFAAVLATSVIGSSLNAQDSSAAVAPPRDEVLVEPSTGGQSAGRLTVNIAAGTDNQQVGDAVIALGDIAVITETVIQRITALVPSFGSQDRATSITIGDGAFSGTTGLTSINITAGSHNQMANLAAIAVGNSGVMTDQLLEQSRASIQPNGSIPEGPLPSNDTIAIGDTAFGDGRGLIQVNLIGGEGNSSANTFALNVPGAGSQ